MTATVRSRKLYQEREIMEHEYVEDLAEELKVDGENLREIIGRLGIRTEQMAVPPYGTDVSAVVSREDAHRLRSHFAEQSATPLRG